MSTEHATVPAEGARPRVVAGLRLIDLVGSGGEGEVWDARDAQGRRRALKLVRPEVLPPPDEFARRGAWLERIDHPALVRVHRVGRLSGSTLDGWGFVEMDFVAGEPLGTAPADPDVLQRLRPLAEGLDLLHAGRWSEGVPLVHRDIKPANLIETADGEVVLVDVSTLRGLDTAEATRVGTPLFAAPEVLTGRAGPPADVYSFAATIVALASGARGVELADLLADPSRLDLPPTVAQALDPDPPRRPGSCAAVLEAGTTIALPEPGAPRPLRATPPPTGRWLAALALVAALLVAAPAEPADLPAPAFVAAALALHVLLTRLAGAPWLLTLVPPAAWAWPLGARAAPPGRARAWTRLGLVGLVTAGVALFVPPVRAAAGEAVGALVAEVGGDLAEPVVAAAELAGEALEVAGLAAVAVPALLAAGGVVLAGAVVAAGRARRVAGALGRLVLLPLWLLGLALALLAALGMLPFRRPAAGRLAVGSLASAGALAGGWGSGRRPPDHRADPRA